MATSSTRPGTELATFDPSTSRFPVLFDTGEEGGVAEVIAENFGDDGFSAGDLDRIVIPSGGGQAWDIPDEDPVRTLTGVVIHQQKTRSMWFRKRGEGGVEDGPPDCSSPDGVVGVGAMGEGSEGNPSGQCDTCPLNVFGTADGEGAKGKKCKEKRDIFILRPESILPVHVSLPPTSLKNHRKYMTRLASKAQRYYDVVTSWTLEVERGNGQTYSVAAPKVETALQPAEREAIRTYRGPIIASLQQLAAERAASAQSATDLASEDGTPGPGSPGWPQDGEDAWAAAEPPADA